MDIFLMLLGCLFISFVLTIIGFSIYSFLERKIRSEKDMLKILNEHDRIEETNPELFNEMEKYKFMRFVAITLAVALLITYIVIFLEYITGG
jgi:cytochrome b subunit of formate dehydrogenase